jgi:hypothetical protein
MVLHFSFIVLLFTPHQEDGQQLMDEIKNVVGNPEGKNYVKGVGAYRKLALKWISLKQSREGVGWICLAQDMALWLLL